MKYEELEALTQQLLTTFSTAIELNAYLNLQVYPKMRERKAQQTKFQNSPVNKRFCALDGTPLTEREVEKASRNGTTLCEITTGRHLRFKQRVKGLGNWIEVPTHQQSIV